MKKLLLTIIFATAFVINSMAQLTYNGQLSYERSRYRDYEISWAGWAHYWGGDDNVGIKMHLNAVDPRMSTTTNKLVFLDSDRSMYIDLYCRTMYQSSDEKLKTNIRPLREKSNTQTMSSNNVRTIQTSPITNMLLKLNPVKYNWKDGAEYEKYNIRPNRTNIEEYGFLAQDLETIIPGAVAMTDEGDKLVNYSALIPILTAAIQELNDRIAILEAQLNSTK